MTIYNGDTPIIDNNILKELITELRLLRLEIAELNEHNEAVKIEAETANVRTILKESNLEDLSEFQTKSVLDYSDELSTAACNALYRSGIQHLADLQFCTKRNLSNVRMIGKKSFEIIKRFADENGIQFSTTSGCNPVFPVGSKVVCIVDKSRNVIKGSILEVDGVYPENGSSVYNFMLPTYKCHLVSDPNKSTPLFSRSELMFYNAFPSRS